MSVVKVIELIGCSSLNWEEAVKSALAEAAKTIQHIKSIYVKAVSANVENNEIVEYKAIVKISFVVDQEL
jgi:dodecin